jgi:UDP-N-acetyl-D-mannosaminuronic acid transferase (WecB/TagA/CpsF family)
MTNPPVTATPPQTHRILGINFFDGSAKTAIEIMRDGGLLVIPAAPALKDLDRNPGYRDALLNADLAITDSAFMVLIWNRLQSQSIKRLSGLEYLRELLLDPEVRRPGNTLWIMASPTSAKRNLAWLEGQGIAVPEDNIYMAPMYPADNLVGFPTAGPQLVETSDRGSTANVVGCPTAGPQLVEGSGSSDVVSTHVKTSDSGSTPKVVGCPTACPELAEESGFSDVGSTTLADPALLDRLNRLRPQHVIMTIGGGTQERLGLYLKRNLAYRPAIHCIGAAIAFLSGDQVHIPVWADKFYLGWLFRSIAEPRRYGPRYWDAFKLFPLMRRYRDRLPDLKA